MHSITLDEVKINHNSTIYTHPACLLSVQEVSNKDGITIYNLQAQASVSVFDGSGERSEEQHPIPVIDMVYSISLKLGNISTNASMTINNIRPAFEYKAHASRINKSGILEIKNTIGINVNIDKPVKGMLA